MWGSGTAICLCTVHHATYRNVSFLWLVVETRAVLPRPDPSLDAGLGHPDRPRDFQFPNVLRSKERADAFEEKRITGTEDWDSFELHSAIAASCFVGFPVITGILTM
jgi:hypothetical protein